MSNTMHEGYAGRNEPVLEKWDKQREMTPELVNKKTEQVKRIIVKLGDRALKQGFKGVSRDDMGNIGIANMTLEEADATDNRVISASLSGHNAHIVEAENGLSGDKFKIMGFSAPPNEDALIFDDAGSRTYGAEGNSVRNGHVTLHETAKVLSELRSQIGYAPPASSAEATPDAPSDSMQNAA